MSYNLHQLEQPSEYSANNHPEKFLDNTNLTI
ncbi:MAG: hypothetical protein ACI840_002772 [Ulvibacter sp.]|jgi:hypothetical protein